MENGKLGSNLHIREQGQEQETCLFDHLLP